MATTCSSSTLLTIFGGRVEDLYSVLTEERLPQGWQPRIRTPMGLTFMAFNTTVTKVELGIAETAANGWKSII